MNTQTKLLSMLGELVSAYSEANMASYRCGVARWGESVEKYKAAADIDLKADAEFHKKLREIIAVVANEC